MSKRKISEEYVQYGYHFKYPKNSIDVRNIDSIDMEWIDGVLVQSENSFKAEKGSPFHVDNLALGDVFKTVRKMCKEHFPEKLI